METKQTIHLDENNKLVVNTNQGVVEEKESYAIIQGEFVIKAENVAKLLSMINEKNVKGITYLYSPNNKYFIANENEYTKDIEMLNNKLKEESEKVDKYSHRNSVLRLMIEKFNETRHWWERKLNIEE